MSTSRPFAGSLLRASLRSVAIALLLVGMEAIPAQAAAGDLDPAFGTGGKVITILPNKGWANQIAIQPDGKLDVAGHDGSGKVTNFSLIRYNTDGSLDTTFGSGGIVTTDFGGADYARAVVLQSGGRIILGGQGGVAPDFGLARYNPDGSLDTTFGVGGKVTTDFNGTQDVIRALLIGPSGGKIIAAGFTGSTGHYDFALARYLPNGSLDPTFGVGGKVTTDFGGVDQGRGAILQSDGKIVVTGFSKLGGVVSDFALARYMPNGSLDSTFGVGGKVTTDFGAYEIARAIVLQPDGKIVAGGYSGCCGGGQPTFRSGVASDLDGLGECSPSDFALARYNPDGTLDTTFGPDGTGKVLTDFNGTGDHARGLALQSDGKLVLAGNSANCTTGTDTFALARYNPDGSLDSAFGTGGLVTTNMGPGQQGARDVKIQADGKIVLAGIIAAASGGGFEYALARYLGS